MAASNVPNDVNDVPLTGYLAIMLYRNWRVLRSAGRKDVVDPKFILRVLAFGIYIFFGMM